VPKTKLKSVRLAQNEWDTQNDLFLESEFSDVEIINKKLSQRWFELSAGQEEPRKRFLEIKSEANNLVEKCYSVAQLASTQKSSIFDECIEIASKWLSLGAYLGEYLPNTKTPKDYRHFGEPLLKQRMKNQVEGVVVSNKMQKTVTILVERRIKHPIYGKYIKKSTKVMVHDEYEECEVGDSIVALLCRPLSKNKTHSFLVKKNKNESVEKTKNYKKTY